MDDSTSAFSAGFPTSEAFLGADVRTEEGGYVYLDYAATTPLYEEAAEAMAPYLVPGRAGVVANANANSLHTPGRSAFKALEAARKSIAAAVGARRPAEIAFTSGATEADNAAVVGLARAAVEARQQAGSPVERPRVAVSAIEHDAVLAAAEGLAAEGFDVVTVAPDAQGFIVPDALAREIDEDTVLVSIQAANSEIGSVQNIAELAQVAHEGGALFHTDATQVFGKIAVDVEAWGVDAASFSGHKIGGPKGIGALYLRARTPFRTQMRGGGQESGLRSGTQNVCAAVGFAAAADASCAICRDEVARLTLLRDRVYASLPELPAVRASVAVPAGSERFLPNIASFCVSGFESETLVLRLDARGFGVSGGSACSSHSLAPSRVLRAIGIDDDTARGSLRVSMGRYTTEADVAGLERAIAEVVKEGESTWSW